MPWVRLWSSPARCRDRYGRLLRYLDVVDGPDAGLAQIRAGVAIARYDSRDGYGWHPREDRYIAADKATPNRTCVAPVPLAPPVPPPNNCMSGYSPCLPVVPDLDCGEIGHEVIVTGSDPYGLDGDGDGTACFGDCGVRSTNREEEKEQSIVKDLAVAVFMGAVVRQPRRSMPRRHRRRSRNCTALNRVYPQGVGLPGAKDKTSELR